MKTYQQFNEKVLLKDNDFLKFYLKIDKDSDETENIIFFNTNTNKMAKFFSNSLSSVTIKHALSDIERLIYMLESLKTNLLNNKEPLIIMRSKLHQLTADNLPCVVTYYPEYLLQKPTDKRKAWDDLKLAMSALEDVS